MNLVLLLLSLYSRASTPLMSAEVMIFHTNFGDIAFRVYIKEAPKASEQIIRLTREGAYNNVELFRVVPDFIIQTNEAKSTTAHRLPLEAKHLKHLPMTLSLAHHDGDTDSGRSSFSFILGNAKHLDGKYTVFGEVVGGQDVLYSLSTLPRVNGGETPELTILIESTEISNVKTFNSKKLKSTPDLTAAFKSRYQRRETSTGMAQPRKQNVLYAFMLSLLFLVSSVIMHFNKKPRATMGLVLLTILVLVYGLVEYALTSPVFPVSWAGIALFLIVLISLKIMSRFENL